MPVDSLVSMSVGVIRVVATLVLETSFALSLWYMTVDPEVHALVSVDALVFACDRVVWDRHHGRVRVRRGALDGNEADRGWLYPERPHCHSTSMIFMSGSVSVAVRGSPIAGWVVDKVTLPSSSTFITVMTRGTRTAGALVISGNDRHVVLVVPVRVGRGLVVWRFLE